VGRRKPAKPAGQFSGLAGAKKPPGASRKPKGPLWTLENGITFSGLSVWENCQEQFGLKYIDGITPKAISGPLEFGNIIHYGLEHQFESSSPLEVIRNITNKYRAWRSKTLLNNNELDTLEFLCGLAEITFPAYCKYWETDDRKLSWVERESKFDIPYTLDERTIRLRGMRDGLFRMKLPGLATPALGIFETKTKSRISEQEIRDGLMADMQTLFYCFVTKLITGEYPKRVKYNIIRRSDTYRRKDESTPTYLSRVKDDIEKRPDHYFSRFTVDLIQRDIDRFQQLTLDPLLRRFVAWWDSVKKNPVGKGRFESSPLHSLNLGALTTKYGKADMWQVIVNGNMTPYRIRSEVFPELEDSFLATP